MDGKPICLVITVPPEDDPNIGQFCDFVEKTMELVSRNLEEEGRLLWDELHNEVTYETLSSWESRLPRYGCGCEDFYLTWKTANPPPKNPNDFFTWGLALHNAVNRKRGVKVWTRKEQFIRWKTNVCDQCGLCCKNVQPNSILPIVDNRCLFLGEDNKCKSYELRPQMCRDFVAGSPACNNLRIKNGLERI